MALLPDRDVGFSPKVQSEFDYSAAQMGKPAFPIPCEGSLRVLCVVTVLSTAPRWRRRSDDKEMEKLTSPCSVS